MAGIYICGAKERDGERGATVTRQVTCPKCIEKARARRAAAKALSAMVPGFRS